MSKTKVELDPNYTPLTPSLVLTADIPGTGAKVITKLFGVVTPQRAAAEKREIKYRAEQLAPAPVRQRRERTFDESKAARILRDAEVIDNAGRTRHGRKTRRDDAYAAA